jgi:hypothetical protein
VIEPFLHSMRGCDRIHAFQDELYRASSKRFADVQRFDALIRRRKGERVIQLESCSRRPSRRCARRVPAATASDSFATIICTCRAVSRLARGRLEPACARFPEPESMHASSALGYLRHRRHQRAHQRGGRGVGSASLGAATQLVGFDCPGETDFGKAGPRCDPDGYADPRIDAGERAKSPGGCCPPPVSATAMRIAEIIRPRSISAGP